MKHLTNQQFADSNEEFRQACERAGIQPTKRQASKFKLKFGRAYECRNGHHVDKDGKLGIKISQD